MTSQRPSPSLSDIYLVRHGESTLNATGIKHGHLDPPLTELGKAQATDIAARLANRIDQVWCSPLRRAYDFADRIAWLLGLPEPTLHDSLMERSFGAAEGMTSEAIALAWPDGDIPGVEQPQQAGDRALVTIATAPPRTAIVTHKGVIRGLTGQGLDNGQILAWP